MNDLIERLRLDDGTSADHELLLEAADALEALAQPEQEPVAWGVFEGNLHDMFFSPSEAQEMADLKGNHAEVRPLYTTPPQREFVGLTYEEKHLIRYSHMTSAEFIEFIEAKLKDKNNG
jgi:formylglycine-generating enzyme required for sulfatase activity